MPIRPRRAAELLGPGDDSLGHVDGDRKADTTCAIKLVYAKQVAASRSPTCGKDSGRRRGSRSCLRREAWNYAV